MDEMMKKILFFDVDGTLYNSKKELPQSAKEAILQARANGHEIAIATGRAPFMIEDLCEDLKIDTYVALNGQYVVYKGDVIYTGGLARANLEKIVSMGEENQHPVVFIDEEKMIASLPDHEGVRFSLETLNCPYPLVERDYFKTNPVYQTLLFIQQQEEAPYKEAFPHLNFVRWHEDACDVLVQGESKAQGIKKLLAKTGYTMENTFGFGDGLNDLEMLQQVGTGVVMGNGHPDVKRVADVEAPHVDEDGLAKVMAQLGLTKS